MDRSQSPVQAVSVAAVRNGKVLLVKRGRSPSRGFFAFPGGRVEPGESHMDAARRELSEETALQAGALHLLRIVHIPASLEEHAPPYELHVFGTHEVIGAPVAGDDADEADFYGPAELASLPTTDSTLEIALELLAAAPDLSS